MKPAKTIPPEQLERINQAVQAKAQRGRSAQSDYEFGNSLLTILLRLPGLSAPELAWRMKAEKRWAVSADAVDRHLRRLQLRDPEVRRLLVLWAARVTPVVSDCLAGEKEAFPQYQTLKKQSALGEQTPPHPNQARILLNHLFFFHPQLRSLPSAREVLHLGPAFSKELIEQIVNDAYYAYGFAPQTVPALDPAALARELARTEANLQRSSEMLEDLQREFEQQLEASLGEERASFFALLNSEKYGCLLDGIFATVRGMDALQQRGYVFPFEIGGCEIMYRNFVRFVRDNGISPIRPIGQVFRLTAVEAEQVRYEGTPFGSDHATKLVRVVSPGWQMKEPGIIIARAQVSEQKEE